MNRIYMMTILITLQIMLLMNPLTSLAGQEGVGCKQLQDVFKAYILDPDPKLAQVENYIKTLKDSLTTTQDPKSKAHLYYGIALVTSYFTSEVAAQEEYLLKALENAKAAGYKKGEAVVLAKLAMVEECKGNVDKARTQIDLAIKIHQELGLQAELATDFCNLGMIEGNNGNYQKAIEYLEKAMKMAREKKYDIGLAFSMCNLSAALAQSGNIKSAKELYDTMQKYRSLTIPFFFYYREQIFSSEMPPIPSFLAAVGGVHTMKAAKGQRQYYNFDLSSYRTKKKDPIIPCGFIEAPYFIP